MPRKQTRSASSAAAAAHLPDAPTFTSFAAATAHALPTYSTTQPTHTATPWDQAALQILKRLSKRDTTTKQRALADLTHHLNNLNLSDTNTGQAFVAAWEPVFRTALQDHAPTVRSAALVLMSLTVRTFRRLVQPIFPTVLPVWVATTGDLSPTVADAAAKSLQDVLPTPTHREKVVDRYADNLRQYAVTAIAGLSSTNFHQTASAALAVLSWLLSAANTSDVIAPVIDDPANPLQFLAKGIKKSATNVAPQVCSLAIDTLSHMTPHDPVHTARAKRFADLSVIVIRMREPAGWDLALMLFRSGWHDAFGDAFGKLPTVVREAVTAPLPTGLHALLPLFDALPPYPASSVFVLYVLNGMRNALRISDVSDNAPLVSVSYSLVALPAFFETASFVHTVAARRWLSGDKDQLAKFDEATFADYVSPACSLFFRGLLPSAPRAQTGKTADGSGTPRKASEGMSTKLVHGTAIHVARLLRGLTDARASLAFSSCAEAFADGLDKPNSPERLRRLQMVLENIREVRCERQFARHVIEELVKAQKYSVESALRALAAVLSTRACSAMVEDTIPTDGYQSLVTKVSSFATVTLAKLSENGKLKEPSSVAMELGTVYSWILWAATALDMKNPLADTMNAVRGTCTPEETYLVLGLIVCAHKARRDLDHVTSWDAIHGKEYDVVVMNAMSVSRDNEAATTASFLVATAVDPNGGSCLSKEVLNHIARIVTEHLKTNRKSNVFDGIITSLLGAHLRFSSSDRNSAFQLLTATSILRAPHVEEMMAALLTQLRCSTTRDVVRLADMITEVLRDAIALFENDAETRTCGRGVAKVMAVVGEGSVEDSVSLCEKLLPTASPSFTAEFLRHVPFRFVFGNGTEVPVRMTHFTRVVETAYSKCSAGFMQDVEAFVKSVDFDERARMTADVVDRFLTSGSVVQKYTLTAMLSAFGSRPQNDAAFRLISQKLHGWLPQDVKSTREFERIPEVILLCSVLSNGVFLDGFKDLLTEAVRIVRKDAFSAVAGVAVDVLTASLAYAANEHGNVGKPAWFTDLVALCLRAVRRCFEQSHSATKDQLHKMDTHAASLTCNSLKCFGHDVVSEDDIRFWTLKCMDTVRAFVQKSTDDNEIRQQTFVRLASIASLSQELIKVWERKETSNAVSSTIDELSHWASWVSVLLLPMIERDNMSLSYSEPEITLVNINSTNKLILKAAERGTLLSKEGGVPVKAEHLYRLVPHLASNFSLSRKAVLTVLAHGAAIDLHEIASRSFPEAGFPDEKEEILFATKMIPVELRKAVSWDAASENPSAQFTKDVRLRELGYFLAWRVFLDLIHHDESASKRTSVEAEDTSFRRVGVTYLRANPSVFAEFFSKCIEVVVDGSATEQAAAGAAASKALEVEERAAQGIRLAQQEREDTEKRPTCPSEKHMDDNIEEAVGHAAGIAFARALQRLPALSRDHVMDRVDRGTSARIESFVRKRVSPLLIATEIRKVKEWGAFGGGAVAQSSTGDSGEGELNARGSVAGREVWATYTFSDVTLEIGMRLPDTFPLQSVQVEARSRIGMSEARWRKTLLGMTTLLRAKDGTLAEAVELWRRNLDKTFQGAEECPICYSVLHLSTAALPKMQCRTCKNLFHSDCLCKWFTKSNSSACPLCRSAF